MTLIDERIDSNALVFVKVLKRVVGMKGVSSNIKFTTIAAGMQLICVFLKWLASLSFSITVGNRVLAVWIFFNVKHQVTVFFSVLSLSPRDIYDNFSIPILQPLPRMPARMVSTLGLSLWCSGLKCLKQFVKSWFWLICRRMCSTGTMPFSINT